MSLRIFHITYLIRRKSADSHGKLCGQIHSGNNQGLLSEHVKKILRNFSGRFRKKVRKKVRFVFPNMVLRKVFFGVRNFPKLSS